MAHGELWAVNVLQYGGRLQAFPVALLLPQGNMVPGGITVLRCATTNRLPSLSIVMALRDIMGGESDGDGASISDLA